MTEGPIGAAAFNNEFGRPNLAGYFRTFETQTAVGVRGYHKPIMIAGGFGNVRTEHVDKGDYSAGAKLVVLGGPAMLIGLGGGAASSMASGDSAEAKSRSSALSPLAMDDAAPPPKPISIAGPPNTTNLAPAEY